MQVLKEEVKENIRKAAISCFMEQDFNKASMREIAKRADISVGNLYRYFPNKESIYDYVVEPIIVMFNEDKPQPPKRMPFLDVNFLQEEELIQRFLEAHMTYREELFILFLRNTGTNYSDVEDRFAAALEDEGNAFIEAEFPNGRTIIEGDIYMKAVAASIVKAFCVVLEQSTDDYMFLKNMIQFVELNVKSSIRYLLNLRDNKVEFRRINNEEIYNHIHHHHHSGCHNRS